MRREPNVAAVILMYNLADTIAAIATPAGEGALAIVRLSGPAASEIAGQLLPAAKLEERRATYGRLVGSDGKLIDLVVAIFYRSPASYTGEDMIEIICHGGRMIPDMVLRAACAAGARPAQAGEFTLRAFLNGKLDLTRAEAIDTIIKANTEKGCEIAAGNLAGRLQERLGKIEDKLFELVTIIEAQIDFNDDEISRLPKSQVNETLQSVADEMKDLLGTYDFGRLASGEATVAIIGEVNTGKSTLFNALLKSDRAITSPDPGTTRDYISDYINIDGYIVKLTDTAGFRDEAGPIESIGISRTQEQIERSDLLLFTVDGTIGLTDKSKMVLDSLHNRKYLLVVTKIDLFGGREIKVDYFTNADKIVKVSAKFGHGIDDLRNRISGMLLLRSQNNSGILLSQRQYMAAQKAYNHVIRAQYFLGQNEPEEILAIELRAALDCFAEILGKVTSDDILNAIFGKFCIGK